MLKAIRNPIAYQGRHVKSKYFEGWYFKHVNQPQNQIISFIVGISKAKHDPHSFIQVIQSNPVQTDYFRFESEAFKANDNPFSVSINHNFFSLTNIRLQLSNAQRYIKANLTYTQPLPITTSIYAPNIMGPFAYIGAMECNHGIASMDHIVNGSIQINDQSYVFENQKGYIEKDWGKSFPKRYIWLQSNHFKDPHTSF